MCAVRVYALLYGTRAQRRGVDSPSSIELTPRANDVVRQASHGIIVGLWLTHTCIRESLHTHACYWELGNVT